MSLVGYTRENPLPVEWLDGQPKSLEIGCGSNPQPGYFHTDVVEGPDVQVVCDAKSLPFPDGYFDSVLMFGVFEHFGIFEIQEVMLEVVRVLRQGGSFKFDVPDFDWFMYALWTNCDKHTQAELAPHRDEDWILKSIFGGQDGPGMFHKWGWNEKRLRAFLEKPNWAFSEIKLVGRQWRDPEANHLIWECLK